MVAYVADCLAWCKPVELLSSSIPELDSPIELPRKHRLMGQHEQIGQTCVLPGLKRILIATLCVWICGLQHDSTRYGLFGFAPFRCLANDAEIFGFGAEGRSLKTLGSKATLQ
jgi:hypothetical protein